MQLSQCAKNLGTALAELRTAAQKVWKLAIFLLEDEGDSGIMENLFRLS